jgi:protein KRI1
LIADPTDSLPDPSNSFKPTFADEERQLKRETTRAFHLGADENDAEEEDEEEDLLQPRAKTKDEREKEDEEYNKFIKANAGDRAVEDALEQEEQFLREWVL